MASKKGKRSPGKSNLTRKDDSSSFLSTDYTTDYTQDDSVDQSNHKDLPSINERLAYLRPSRELLEYYRKKIGEFDGEHEEMKKKLETYRCTYEEQHKIQWDIRQREEEISELQKALSDMQVYLFQEREHVLRLYSENDRLKIRELEDRKKIHALLTLSGLTEREVSYFLKEPPAKAIVQQKLPAKLLNQLQEAETRKKLNIVHSKTSIKDGKRAQPMTAEESKHYKDNDTLRLQVEALQAQIVEQTKLVKEQVDALTEDRRIKAEEYETRRQRDTDKVATLTEKLHKTQDLLYDSTRDFLDMKYENRANERRWMAEKDKFLQELDLHRTKLDAATRDKYNNRQIDILEIPDENIEARLRASEEFKVLENELQQSQKLADMYREQVIQLEDELSKIREEGEVGKELFKERCEKMAKRLELMNARYTDLERRRNLEVEGFKTDIRHLRDKLKSLEKQLYKVTIGFSDFDEEIPLFGKGSNPGEIDMAILRAVHKTAGRSKNISDNLKTLKAKVYGLESDLKHL